MTDLRESMEKWLRHGSGPLARRLRRTGTSATATYAAYVGYGLGHPELRRPLSGADASEPLPGDALVARPDSNKTFAVDIAAAPDKVWALLVQMGYGRAGWYAWYPLDNGGVESAAGPVSDLQDLKVGDLIPDGPRAAEGLGVWRVVELAAPSTLVLFSRRALTTGRELAADVPEAAIDVPVFESSWAFVVTPEAAGSRLRVRVRARLLGTSGSALGGLVRRFFDLGDTVMEWTMLDGIKARAERGAASAPPAA